MNMEQITIANQSVAVREEFDKRAIKPAPMAKLNSSYKIKMGNEMN